MVINQTNLVSSNRSEVAYIGIGSNLNSPLDQVRDALNELSGLPQTQLLAQSSLYSSAAIGPGEQADYVNAVAALATELNPEALLIELQALEKNHGRIRKQLWEPRPLDLDILLFGNRTIASATLSVPHPQMSKRHFVLYPLAEIAPELCLPDNTPLAALLKQCPIGELLKLADC